MGSVVITGGVVTRLRTEQSGVQIPAWSEDFSLFLKRPTPHFMSYVEKLCWHRFFSEYFCIWVRGGAVG
jgi:hypothetical protein